MFKKHKSLLGTLFAGATLIATVRGAAADVPNSQIPCNLQSDETPLEAAKNIIGQMEEKYVDPSRTREGNLWAAAGSIPVKVNDAKSCEALYAAIRRITQRDPHSKFLPPIRFDSVDDTEPNPVTHYVIKENNINVAYIHLAKFSEDTHVYIEDALRDEMQRNHVQAIILNLEGNQGGLIGEIGPVAGIFLPKDRLVFTSRNLNGKETAHYVTRSDGMASGLPLVVLVNDQTASSAEAVVAALQYYHVATIVGQRTYGKAIAQTGFLQLKHGILGEAELVLTTHWLYLPSDASIQIKGIIADVNVLGDKPAGPREENLLNPLPNPNPQSAQLGPRQAPLQCVPVIGGLDRDLRCAIAVLAGGTWNGVTVVPTRQSLNKNVERARPSPD